MKVENTEENYLYCEDHDIMYMESDDKKWLLIHPEDKDKAAELLYSSPKIFVNNGRPLVIQRKQTSMGVKKYGMVVSEFERIKNKVPGCVVVFRRRNKVLVSVPVDDAERFEKTCKEEQAEFHFGL